MYKKILVQIANTLFINIQHSKSLGLLDGRTGIALFLYHYARYTDNKMYSELAGIIIDQIYASLSKQDNKCFFNGLAGIGYAIDQIIKSEFVEVDEEDGDILEEVDLIIGKMTQEDFLLEIDSEMPLFSKGLYFLKRKNKYPLSKVARECLEFLTTDKKEIPLSYLNSIFYFINSISSSKYIEEDVLNNIYDNLFIAISKLLIKYKYKMPDIYILNRNIENIKNKLIKEKWLHLSAAYNRPVLDIFNMSWIHFIYDYNMDWNISIENQVIQEILIDKIRNLVPKDLYLYNGLAGFGLSLMKISEKNIRPTRVAKKDIDVLYLSTNVEYGGQFRAAHRIHQGLRCVGVNSEMLVLNSSLGLKENLLEKIYVAKPEEQERPGYFSDLQPLKNYPKYNVSFHSFAPAIAGIDVNRYIECFDPKIVQIHWVNAGYIKIEDIGKIKNKIVWRLADYWPLTGGCYYFGKCQRYMTGCGKCPKLGSEKEEDLSHEVWLRKEKAWKNMNMTIVVPTPQMKQIVEKSTLLKGRKVFVIPNGLDLTEFYPINKKTARESLDIPLDKKVILYGATNAISDPRKGFSLLLQALQYLSKKHKLEYYFVIFGADPVKLNLDIPYKIMGYVNDHNILQTLYSAADVMVVPSLEEAFGQTVTEAMACSTPVISFQETGPADIIEHKKTGYLAKYADFKDLSNGIEWIFEDSLRLNMLSNNAKNEVICTYDIKIIAAQYKKLYRKISNDEEV